MNPNNKLKVLRMKICDIRETHIRYGKTTNETKMRFSDILKELDVLSESAE